MNAPPFCANPQCVLHVRPDDPRVQGQGHWALRPDGVWVGQTAHDGAMYCDLCVRAAVLTAPQASTPADPMAAGGQG